ncbi:hypothetical protein NKJ08_18045, partial [Mesorhizobium sp. M0244]
PNCLRRPARGAWGGPDIFFIMCFGFINRPPPPRRAARDTSPPIDGVVCETILAALDGRLAETIAVSDLRFVFAPRSLDSTSSKTDLSL